jgi:hypothetical protein
VSTVRLTPTFVLLATLLLVVLAAGPAGAVEQADAAHLVERATALHLADRPEWLRLLHFVPTVLGRFESEVDGDDFFLSPAGKRDAAAELAATLRAFALPVVPGHEDEHALCRLPARRTWLDDELHFITVAPRCPALRRSFAGHPLAGASLVYATNSLRNPASTFGHTFLRLRVEAPDGTPAVERDRLDVGAEYRAVTTQQHPLAYALMAMGGLYSGKVEIIPYVDKLRAYNDAQGRDVWEYDLGLTPRELQMLAFHLWEIERTSLDYYYLRRNCSYETLVLLEAAAPRLDLLASVKLFVFPADTLRAVTEVPGLVRGVAYRPSRRHVERATLPLEAPRDEAPDLAHGPMRVLFGAGADSQYASAFGTLGYRLALHDLTDPPSGWPRLSQVVILDTRLRYDLSRRVLSLDRLTFADLMSIHPLTVEPLPSWRITAFGDRLHDRACADCFSHGLDTSIGGALATPARAITVFVMGDAYAGFLPETEGVRGTILRLGVGPFAGVRLQAGHTALLATGTVSYLPWQKLDATFDARLTVKNALSRDVVLGIEADAQPLSVDGQLVGYVYF